MSSSRGWDAGPSSSTSASMDVEAALNAEDWEDDAFFARLSRQRNPQSRASQIYGVFADSDDDDQEERKSRKGRKKSRLIDDEDEDDEEDTAPRGLGAASAGRGGRGGSSALARTVRFVSSSQPPAAPAPDERKETEPHAQRTEDVDGSVDDASAAAHSGLGFKRRRLAEKQRIDQQKLPDEPVPSPSPPPASAPARPFRPPARDADFAAFTKHSSGAALRMLEKMGFRGRLGKHETGISAPILPVLRPKSVGLGGIKEKTTQMARNVHEEERMEEERKKEKQGRAAQPSPVPVPTRGWRKGAPKPKKTFRTASEVKQATLAAPPTVIIDMTAATPVQRHLGQLSSAAVPAATPSAVPELQHNVQLLVDLAEAEIQQLDRRMQELRVEMEDVEREHERNQIKATKEAGDVQRLEDVIREVERMQRAVIAMNERPLDERLAVLEEFVVRVRREWSREWRMYQLVQVVVVMLYPIVRALVHEWETLPASPSAATSAQSAHVFTVLSRWRELLDESVAAGYYHELVSSLLLPPLRLALSSSSLSLDHPEPIKQLFDDLHRVLPPSLFSSLAHSLLLPKLQTAVAQWNPRVSPSPHSWLIPFADVLSRADMASLYSVVRQKLMHAAASWQVDQADVRDALAAWQGVWERDEMDAFINKLILPKLIAAFSERPAVAPASAASASAESTAVLLEWRSLLPADTFQSLVRHLLSGFLHALHDELAEANPNYELLLGFYSTYSALLSPLSLPLVTRGLQLALDLLNAAMEDRPLATAWRAARSFMDEPASFSTASPTPTAFPTPRPSVPVAATEQPALTGKELLYAWGERHGFDVYPSGRRRAGGHEVYAFGNVSVYWNGEDVYALDERTKEWTLVSLPTLLQWAQQRNA